MKKKQKRYGSKVDKDLLRISIFILFDAFVFHEALAGIDKTVASLRTLKPSFQKSIEKQWKYIIDKIDYQPVFGVAKEILSNFPTSPDTEGILKELIGLSIDALSSGILLKHDFMGRIYHKLLLRTTGEYYATYYTSIPAAWLISNLIFKTPNQSWNFSDLESVGKLTVIDPACGSGTLLSASYMAMKDMYILSRPEKLDLVGFHQACIEDILHGWDILDYATHLTLTTLALHNYRARFSQSRVYTLPAGVTAGGKVHLGSLDYLFPQSSFVGKGFASAQTRMGMAEEREEEIILPNKGFDVVIMNPPFSRSAGTVNTKFGYSNEDAKKRMTKELQKLTKFLRVEGIGQAGLGAHFIILADKLLKRNGSLGIVIPRAVLSGVSWEKIRELIIRKYELEYIVSNHDSGDRKLGIEGWNWSENTKLGEVLLVARKTDKDIDKRKVLYINLWNKPKNEVESLIIARQVLSQRKSLKGTLDQAKWQYLKLGGKEIGGMYFVPQNELGYNWLRPCVFANPSLNKLVLDLFKTLPLEPMSKISNKLGVDRKQIETSFKTTSTSSPYKILWGEKGGFSCMTVTGGQLSYAQAKSSNAKSIYETHRANLLLNEVCWLNSRGLTALYAEEPILSTLFWEIGVEKNFAKILTLWFNSTYGFLTALASSISSVGDWFILKKSQIEKMHVLDIGMLNSTQLSKLEAFFENVRNSNMKPFPVEFQLASTGAGLRKVIDDLVLDVLNLKVDLNPFYPLLAKEPVISLTRW